MHLYEKNEFRKTTEGEQMNNFYQKLYTNILEQKTYLHVFLSCLKPSN